MPACEASFLGVEEAINNGSSVSDTRYGEAILDLL
jgi:hypothetical protein